MSNEELVMLIKQGNKNYISRLWEQNEKFFTAHMCALYAKNKKCFTAAGYEYADIMQEGYFVMLAMIDAFDVNKNVKFLTYFGLQAKNHINRIVLKKDYLGKSKDVINSARSIDEEIKGLDDDSLALSDIIPDEAATFALEAADDRIYNTNLADVLNACMKKYLTEQQEDIIKQRYYYDVTFKSIADKQGVSIHAIEYHEHKALHKLRKADELKAFVNNFIIDNAYSGTNLSSFKNKQGSSPELIVERLDKIIIHIKH